MTLPRGVVVGTPMTLPSLTPLFRVAITPHYRVLVFGL